MLKWIEIDLSAIAANLESVREQLSFNVNSPPFPPPCLAGRQVPVGRDRGRGVKLMGVVKADAYGHGAVPVSRLLEKRGVDCLGVLTVEESSSLRRSKIRSPLILLAPPLPEEVPELLRWRLIPTVDSGKLLQTLDQALKNHNAFSTPSPIKLDLDFGLGRWGISPKELPRFLREIKKYPRLKLVGLSTHLDYMPGRNAVEAEEKLRAFDKISKEVKKQFPEVLCHAANSSILLDFPHRQMDMVRAGNLLYGINLSSKKIPLKNSWQFYARLISIKKFSKGKSVGYGSEYVAPRAMTLGTLPVGYADGLTMEPADKLISLHSSFQYWGTFKGKPAPFISRCGISHVLVDLSKVSSIKVGDAVCLPVRRTAASSKICRVYKGEGVGGGAPAGTVSVEEMTSTFS
ncbi:MAG: alanine racemase [Elusimicrobia bacterium]|nr:alanine racemase [Elusimicrobiota bacterium]